MISSFFTLFCPTFDQFLSDQIIVSATAMLYVLAPINLAADCITRDDGSIEQDVQAIGQWSSIDIVCRYAVVFPPTLTFSGTHTLAT